MARFAADEAWVVDGDERREGSGGSVRLQETKARETRAEEVGLQEAVAAHLILGAQVAHCGTGSWGRYTVGADRVIGCTPCPLPDVRASREGADPLGTMCAFALRSKDL